MFVCANVTSGVLQVTRDEPDGRIQIVGLLFPGDFAGDVFTRYSPDTITALTDVSLCVYPRTALTRMLDEYSGVTRLLLQRTLATLASTRRSLAMLAHTRASARLAAFLFDMADRAGVMGEAPFQLPLSRSAIGAALGIAAETVSRNMKALRSAGLVETEGARTIRLLDRVRLARLLT